MYIIIIFVSHTHVVHICIPVLEANIPFLFSKCYITFNRNNRMSYLHVFAIMAMGLSVS